MLWTLLLQSTALSALIIASRLDQHRSPEKKRYAPLWRALAFALFISALSFSHLRDIAAICGYLAAMFGRYDIAAALLATYHTLAVGDPTTSPIMVAIRLGLAMAALTGITITDIVS